MWEERACIYGTPGIPNNFPLLYIGYYITLFFENQDIIIREYKACEIETPWLRHKYWSMQSLVWGINEVWKFPIKKNKKKKVQHLRT